MVLACAPAPRATLARSRHLSIRRISFAALLALALLLHCRYFLWHPEFTAIEHTETTHIATSLVMRGDFADPYASTRTGPTAHLPPIWPLVMAGALKLAGADENAYVLIALTISGVAWGVCLCGLPLLSRLYFRAESPGWVAAAIGLLPVYPIAVGFEATLTAAGLVWLLITYRVRGPLLSGFSAGLLALLQPIASFAALAAWRDWKRASLLFTRLALTLLPWTIRNYVQLGALVSVRDNFGLELYVSNWDQAEATRLAVIHRTTWPHPATDADEGRRVVELGEIGYMAERGRLARQWISAHPDRVARLTVHRALLWCFPYRTDMGPYPWLTCAVALIGIAGLVWARAWRLLAICVLFSRPYYVVHAHWRYTTPTS